VGDKVWLQAKNIKVHQQSAKLGPKQLGPFEVKKVVSHVDYQLALPPALKVHDTFHVDHLSAYKGNAVNGLLPPPPDPVTIEGEEEYEVDHIRDSKLFGRTLKFLVRWKGYGEARTLGNQLRIWIMHHTPYRISIVRIMVLQKNSCTLSRVLALAASYGGHIGQRGRRPLRGGVMSWTRL